jgi:hypothetical protein
MSFNPSSLSIDGITVSGSAAIEICTCCAARMQVCNRHPFYVRLAFKEPFLGISDFDPFQVCFCAMDGPFKIGQTFDDGEVTKKASCDEPAAEKERPKKPLFTKRSVKHLLLGLGAGVVVLTVGGVLKLANPCKGVLPQSILPQSSSEWTSAPYNFCIGG